MVPAPNLPMRVVVVLDDTTSMDKSGVIGSMLDAAYSVGDFHATVIEVSEGSYNALNE